MRKLDVQAMTPEEQVAWLSRILAPAVMTTSVAKAYWSTLARALMPEEEALTAMQVAEVDILEQEPHADRRRLDCVRKSLVHHGCMRVPPVFGAAMVA